MLAELAQPSLRNIRQLQVDLGDIGSMATRGTVSEGYTLRRPPPAGELRERLIDSLLASFPTGNTDLDRELARTLALLTADVTRLAPAMLGQITPSSDPRDDLHLLIVVAHGSGRVPAPLAAPLARALLDLEHKCVAQAVPRDRHWPLRVAELAQRLAERVPDFPQTLLAQPTWGAAGHIIFTDLPGMDRPAAARRLLLQARTPGWVWTTPLVRLLSTLPAAEVYPLLREHADDPAVSGAILQVLAAAPRAEDRRRFLNGLTDRDAQVAAACLDALARLSTEFAEPDELLALVRALRHASGTPALHAWSQRLAERLERLTRQRWGTDPVAWEKWLVSRYPGLPVRLHGPDGVDRDDWERRLAQVPWDRGDPERGRRLYGKLGCAACHGGAHAVGPDLAGIGSRFTRADLLTALIEPSRDVADRYRARTLLTHSGQVYFGIVIYEATDGLLIQTGPAATSRIAADQIAEQRPAPVSLMPAGLLDPLRPDEIADLVSFLQAWRAPVSRR